MEVYNSPLEAVSSCGYIDECIALHAATMAMYRRLTAHVIYCQVCYIFSCIFCAAGLHVVDFWTAICVCHNLIVEGASPGTSAATSPNTSPDSLQPLAAADSPATSPSGLPGSIPATSAQDESSVIRESSPAAHPRSHLPTATSLVGQPVTFPAAYNGDRTITAAGWSSPVSLRNDTATSRDESSAASGRLPNGSSTAAAHPSASPPLDDLPAGPLVAADGVGATTSGLDKHPKCGSLPGHPRPLDSGFQ